MPENPEKLRGVVQGRTILLDREPGIPDGSKVVVTVEGQEAGARTDSALGLRRAFGAWAPDGEALDNYLEWNRRQRKVQRPREEA